MTENKSVNEGERNAFPLKSVKEGEGEGPGKIEENSQTYRKRVAGNRGESMCPGEIELYTVKTRVVCRQTTGATIEIPKWWIVLHAYFRSPI